MAYVTEADFLLMHPRGVTIAAAGPVTTTQFAKWITWATNEVNIYAKRTTNFASGTRAFTVASTCVDTLLIKKWIFEENVTRFDPEKMADMKHPTIHDADMEPLRRQLDTINQGDQPDDAPSWNQEMNMGYYSGGLY